MKRVDNFVNNWHDTRQFTRNCIYYTTKTVKFNASCSLKTILKITVQNSRISAFVGISNRYSSHNNRGVLRNQISISRIN